MPPQPTSQMMTENTSLYLFKRWQWVHLPWIALSNPLTKRPNEGPLVTRAALDNVAKAKQLRRRESMQASWDCRKKDILGDKTKPKSDMKLRGIINTVQSPALSQFDTMVQDTPNVCHHLILTISRHSAILAGYRPWPNAAVQRWWL